MTKPSDEQIRALIIQAGGDPESGELIKSRFYAEPDGERHIRALVDYGVGGVKVFDVPLDILEPPAAEKSLEDLNVEALKEIARDLDVAVSGKKTELIVRIRQAIEDKAKAEIDAAEADEGTAADAEESAAADAEVNAEAGSE